MRLQSEGGKGTALGVRDDTTAVWQTLQSGQRHSRGLSQRR